MRVIPFLCALLLSSPALAEDAAGPAALDMQALMELAAEPWHDRASFQAELEALLPGLRVSRDRAPDTVDDPFAWVLTGTFASQGPGSYGAHFGCARYGLASHEWMAGRSLSDRDGYRLISLYHLGADEIAAWPETGVARLSCLLSWDDTRAVEILPRADVLPALTAQFEQVEDRVPAGQAAFYGDDGYRFVAQGGPEDSSVVLDTMRVILTLRHQAIQFRSYLLNGGM